MSIESVNLHAERLESLRNDLKVYGDEITKHIIFLQLDKNSPSILDTNLKNDPVNMLLMLKHDVAEMIDLSLKNSDFAVSHSNDIAECSRLVKVLTDVSSLSEIIIECDKLISSYKFVPAAGMIVQIKFRTGELFSEFKEFGYGKVLHVLRNESNMLSSKLISKLKRCLNACVRIEHGKISVSKLLNGVLRSEDLVLTDCPVQLNDVWSVIVQLEMTEDIVKEILSEFWRNLLRPLWNEKKSQSPRIIATGDEASELVFDTFSSQMNVDKILPDFASLNVCKMPLPSLFECIGQLFGYLWADVFCGNASVVQCAASLLSNHDSSSPFCITAILVQAISTNIPKNEAELVIYKRNLERPCAELEAKLSIFGFNTEGTPVTDLSNCLQKLTSVYCDVRRKDILRRAREVVLSDYHNTMVAATGDALEDDLSSAGSIGDSQALLNTSGSFTMQKLRFEQCQVSLSANRILKLVNDVMRQACDAASTIVANVLFQSARDCLEIFVAIVPMKFSSAIEATPRMGAVFYNDCLYIAHNSTLITHRFRSDMSRIDEVLESSIGFVDFIPRFRSAGEQCLRTHLEDQRAALNGLVRQIHLSSDGVLDLTSKSTEGGLQQGGVGNDEEEDFETVLNDENGAEKVRAHMERLGHQWLGVLSEDVYTRVMCSLLDKILEQLMTPLMCTDCISAEACTEISRIFKVIQRIRNVLSIELLRGNDDAIVTLCPLWRKFLVLTELLDFNLGDIAEWLPRKKFVVFSGAEMTSLVKALFDDNEKRKSVLQAILSLSS